MLFGLFARIYICVVCYLPILNVDCIFCIVLFVLYMFCVFVSICAYLLSPFVILFCGVCVLVGCSISIFCSAFLHLFFYFGVLHLYISINFIILHFDSYFLGPLQRLREWYASARLAVNTCGFYLLGEGTAG